MASRLVIDGNTIYEIDEDCEQCKNGICQGQRTGAARRVRRQEGTRKKSPKKK